MVLIVGALSNLVGANRCTLSIKPNSRMSSSLLLSEASKLALMASSWRRSVGNVRSFVGNSMGGLRGGSNLASWGVACTLAYFLWVKPSQELKREQEEKAAGSDPYRYVEKRKPIPDPQETGLIYGKKRSGTMKPED
eukprot:TRINITY_DN5580_c0_g1_i1.p1 TRINITY_DN5580_c0_g1~~TRINITY_DN5580_c0_g1_i1.p1  ORF type:complete len:137 (+),score=10.35 TRINITY_DN5580_c0_g1_i1:71-481(+)